MYYNEWVECRSDTPLFHSKAHPAGDTPPTDVSVAQMTSTSASVSWIPPEDEQIFLYYICFVPVKASESKELGFARGTEILYTQTELNEGSTYLVFVIARGTITSAADPVIFTLGTYVCSNYSKFWITGRSTRTGTKIIIVP